MPRLDAEVIDAAVKDRIAREFIDWERWEAEQAEPTPTNGGLWSSGQLGRLRKALATVEAQP